MTSKNSDSIDVTEVEEHEDGSAILHLELGDDALKCLLKYAVTKVELNEDLVQELIEIAMLDIIKKKMATEQVSEEENDK